ncbi:hypothetical protein RIF29_13350 [Crotalaria pallida]|uniref:Uncharacterized protein n=1 Tax=Crotalaria pallida TaxID=3830 RepID=A0AAN9P1Z1_CROPI
MASMLSASSTGSSSISIHGGSHRRNKQYAENRYYASSYVPTLCHKTGKIRKEQCVIMSSRHNLNHHYKVINEGSPSQESERKYVAKATSGQSFESGPQAQEGPKTILVTIKDIFDAFYKFSRPYSAIEGAISATSLSFLAVEQLSDFSPAFFIALLQFLVVSFFLNVAHCGFNQLCDVEIDKINKPYLLLASGEWSFRNGVFVVSSSLLLSFILAWIVGSWPLFWSFLISALLTGAYSLNLPLLRWKNNPLLAAVNIFANAAIARPLGYYFHMQTQVFKRQATFSRPLILSIAILSLYFLVVALFKDIPDVEGDKKFGVKSLAVRLGQTPVFRICISLLQMTYGAAILAGATSPFLWSKLSMVLGHGILSLALWYRSKSVDLNSIESYQSFYGFIWKVVTDFNL